jgi:putrescine transport system ATP-binding protein
VIKVSQSNVERHSDDHLTWDDMAWASWSPTSQVVLTQ